MSIKKLINLTLLLALSSSPAMARDRYFFGAHLPAPPEKGSAAYDQDFITLHDLQDHRTPDECATADLESSFTLENGFGPATGVLTDAEVKKAKLLSDVVIAETAVTVFYFKHVFKRVRPYNEDTTLTPCIRKPGAKDYAYPSGHSTTGYALALALSKKFPAKKEAILKQGLQIGENRLIGGVHHPSDVEAGRILAAQIVKGVSPSLLAP